MKKIILIISIMLVIIFGFFSLLNRSSNEAVVGEKMLVSASFYPVYFFAKEIAKDHAEVLNITPAGAEPHDYELSAKDISNIEKSKILILNGGGLEPWGESMKKNLASSETLVVEAGEGVADKMMMENGKDVVDPHVWLSPELAEKMADNILEAFKKSDPKNVDSYIANAALLKLNLKELGDDFRVGLSECKKKEIITSHTAFGYLAAAYGFSQIAITGMSPSAEPSIQQLREIIDLAKKNDIKYIFFESLVSPKLSETLASEVGAETLVLNPLEGLTKKELSEGKDYFTEMRANLNNLQMALECKKQ